MVFSDIFGSCIWVSRKIRKLDDAKMQIGFFFNFIGISLGDKKFNCADIGTINFHYFLFVAVQNFKLGFLQNSNFGQQYF